MRRFAAPAALLLLSASPSFAQRAGENAVASAKDAFGTSVGNERVGLYTPQMPAASAPSRPATCASTASISIIRPTSTRA